jgi:hypothetical protein
VVKTWLLQPETVRKPGRSLRSIEEIDGKDSASHDLHLVVLPQDEEAKNGHQVDRHVREFQPFEHRHLHRRPFLTINNTNSQTSRLKNYPFSQLGIDLYRLMP